MEIMEAIITAEDVVKTADLGIVEMEDRMMVGIPKIGEVEGRTNVSLKTTREEVKTTPPMVAENSGM